MMPFVMRSISTFYDVIPILGFTAVKAVLGGQRIIPMGALSSRKEVIAKFGHLYPA
jgi:hypothetical protein